MTGATLIAPPAETAAPAGTVTSRKPAARKTYSCPECEHVLRVSGLGRHRAYFECSDEFSHDPVMDRVCPECGHGLPGKSPR
jgi:DNA-directed RNA polymerase subunit RPC12/RpoP